MATPPEITERDGQLQVVNDSMTAPKIWISHFSVASWTVAEAWDTYFRTAERILGDRLTKLDHRDPVRRTADTQNHEGNFVVEFEKNHVSRSVAGKFERSKVWFSVNFYTGPTDQYGRETYNYITIHLPQNTDLSTIFNLFEFGNSHLKAFYSYSDLQPVITEKGKLHQRSTSGFDIERELVGVFWLTYFGPAYGDFFGRERMLGFKGAIIGSNGDASICLGKAPSFLTSEREQAEQHLGAKSFAGHGILKRPGEFALTIADLRIEANQSPASRL